MTSQPSVNPYQAPQVNLENDYADDSNAYWCEGKVLVLKRDGQLPPRCVKCNADSAHPLRKKTLAWHHPAWYLLIFLHPFIYIVGGLIVRKRAKIEYGLCDRHVTRRYIGIGVSVGAFFVALASLFWLMGRPSDNGLAISLIVIGLLTSIVFAMTFARSIYARKIDQLEVRIGGCGKPFLEGAMRKVIF